MSGTTAGAVRTACCRECECHRRQTKALRARTRLHLQGGWLAQYRWSELRHWTSKLEVSCAYPQTPNRIFGTNSLRIENLQKTNSSEGIFAGSTVLSTGIGA